MTTRFHPTTKRVAVVILVAFAIIVASSQTLFAAQTSRASSPSHAITLQHSSKQLAIKKGEINLATLPTYKAPANASKVAKSLPVDRALKTPAQQAAYEAWVKAHASQLPHSTGPSMSATQPNMYGNGAIPVLVNQADGINFTQSGCGCTPPDQAVGAAPGYVFEGVNNLLEVYNTAYAPKFGPWQASTFFGPVFHAGDFFSDPQITWNAERAVWMIAWLEINSTGTADYIDIAVSKTDSPSPLGNYLLYQVPANVVGANVFCDYETLGYEYWGLWLSCVDFNGSTGAFLGNTVFDFSTNGLLAGSAPFVWYNNIPLEISAPAYRLSPTMEDGVAQAEWVIATDAGYGVTTQNLTLCAFTNPHAIVSGSAPTGTCDFNNLPLAYDDPINAAEAGGGSVYPGVGTKQIAYRNGRLYFALPLAFGSCSGSGAEDGLLWAEVQPQLTTFAAHNPQWVNGITDQNVGYWCFSNGDSYMPTFMASGEDDAALVFNASNSGQSPSIYWTGRQASDAYGTMGQTSGIGNNGGFGIVLLGTAPNNTGRFGDYSACALTTNLVSRGIVFCGGEYGGADVWNTRLYQLRME